MPARCCVLVLTYNGRKHLELCMPSLMEAAARVPGGCPVIVADNRSTDDSLEWLRREYPQAEIRVASRNDYLFSLNEVAREREEEIVVILNNDMHFDRDFIVAMLPHFDDPGIFAVTARVMDWDGQRQTTGQRVGEIRNAWFYKSWNMEVSAACETLDAGGGCAGFRTRPFNELGGFDPLYRPAYWEDTDLSYRARRRGWKIIYEPASVIYHRVGATLDETEGGRPSVTRLIRRNEVLFAVRNVGGWGFVISFLTLLPVRMVRNALAGNHAMWRGALRALPKIPAALLRRLRDAKGQSDLEFLQQISRPSRAMEVGMRVR